MSELLDKLCQYRRLEREEWRTLLASPRDLDQKALFDRAAQERRTWFGDEIYVRGLIECSNICKNNCLYCGIRRDNRQVSRYRLDRDTILACCEKGYAWGFRTFVLQGGEDPGLTPDWVAETVAAIKRRWPDCAVTLSLGEFDRAIYQLWFDAGADRYLLRHETADAAHYGKLHPPELTLAHRLDCLHTLKDIGYQVGAGFMVGSPGQTADTRLVQNCDEGYGCALSEPPGKAYDPCHGVQYSQGGCLACRHSQGHIPAYAEAFFRDPSYRKRGRPPCGAADAWA